MRLITSFELATLNETELAALFNRVSKELTRTRKGSPERTHALASLENIRRARLALKP